MFPLHNKIIIFSFFLLLPSLVGAQKWDRYKHQLTFGLGASNFLGELGGADHIGTTGLRDIDLIATRPAAMIGYRHQINSSIVLRGNLTYAILNGDDKYTKDVYRRGRNLSFRSECIELALMGEFYIVQNSRNSIYTLRNVRGSKGLGLDLYLFGGIGGLYFNPKAKDKNGKWIELQPLGTEGQGLPGEDEKYDRITMVIPFGFGIGKSINRFWSINIEFAMRKTFTDYIDDVSTDYYDEEALAKGNSELAAYFGNGKAIYDEEVFGPATTKAGEQRGNPNDMDSYIIGMITVTKKLYQRRRSRPKF